MGVEERTQTVGAILREKREQAHMTLQQVAKRTKVSVHYLEIMEEDRFAELPPGTYALAYIRNYAKFLGLDADALLKQVREDQLPKKKLKAERYKAEILEETLSIVPSPSLTVFTLICTVVIVVLYAFYHKVQQDDVASEQTPIWRKIGPSVALIARSPTQWGDASLSSAQVIFPEFKSLYGRGMQDNPDIITVLDK